MNQTFQSIRVGVFFVLGLALIYTVYFVIGSRTFRGDEGYTLTAEFDNLRTLTAGADVRIAGVRVGEVTETALANGRGRASLKILPDVQIPGDSVASINMASLLGQNYVSVEYGKEGATLAEGDTILTRESADFNEILGEVQKLGERLNTMADSFSGFGGEGLGDLVENLNGLVTDNRGRIDTTMQNIEELTTKLNKGEGTLGRLISDDALYNELMGTVEEFRSSSEDLRTALGGAREMIAKIENGEGTLGRLLVGEGIADDLELTVANFKAFSEKLNSGEGTLGKLVTDDSLYVELQNMLNKADQALDSVGDSGPITALGAVSGALF